MSVSPKPLPPLSLAELRKRLDQACTRDRGRLIGQWRKLSRGKTPNAEALARLGEAVDRSLAQRQARMLAKPELALDTDLPISARAEDIIGLVREHQVVVVAGETGSGKTTQLPKLCLAAGRGEAGLIGCTQPRRLAARSVARRVAEELGGQVGGQVGFQVRFSEQVGEDTLVKFMTDGILLAQTQADPWLSEYDTLIIDEAHERSLNIDFLLGYLKRLLDKRRDLKLVITSATIDTARFAAHFDAAPVVEVAGRTFPVEVRWRPAEDREMAQGSPEHVAHAIDELGSGHPHGDILVFLPGEREIRDTHLHLSRRGYRHTEILPLYARLSARDQDRVFHPGPARRIVLATNVAETSLTVPRIHAVVDTGTARVMRYSQRSQIQRLHVEPVSQAAADQRKGRCGRVGPGVCIRLYGEADYIGRPRFTEPELLRSSLANVILRMLSLKLGEVEDFPFLDMPEPRAIADGYRRLAEVQAIDSERRLTPLGRELSPWPVDVQLARMLVEARRLGALHEMLVIVAFMSVQDPRERPPEARQQADAAHREFADAGSDLIGVLNLWNAWVEARETMTQSRLRDWCRKHFVGFLRMREWGEVHRQLKLAMRLEQAAHDSRRAAGQRASVPAGADGTGNGPAENYAAIHLSLLSGLPTQVGHKDEQGIFRGTRERKFQLFPGSALAKKPPAWVFAGQILDIGGRVWGMQCARVEPAWIERQAAHLLRRSWREPHWSRKRGAVMAFEQVSLFGMVLVERRPVVFRDQDRAQAHAIFVREALLRCELDAKAAFVRANARVLAEAEDIEARQRRQGLIRDEQELAQFFAGKLPETICDARALDAWYRKASASEQAALHWSLADLLGSEDPLDAGAFPSSLELAGQRCRLTYHFVPGDEADGVSLHVPLALLDALPGTRLEWLVPGLLADKAAAMIRGLPKALRRNFVPAPDFARAFVESDPPHGQSLAETLARFLVRATGVIVQPEALSASVLPEHLRMRLVLLDERGKPMADGRDLDALRAQWKGQARAAFTRKAEVDIGCESATEWMFGEIPARIVAPGKPDAYPALVDQGASVALRVFARNEEARAAHLDGVQRLLRIALEKGFREAARKLPLNKVTALQHAPLGKADELRADLVEGGFVDLLAERDLMLRNAGAFDALRAELAGGLFAAAVARLQLVEAVIAAQAAARPMLRPTRAGQAGGGYADMHSQFEQLLAPGFARKVPAARLRHFPRYLEALRLRGERLRRDPGKDHRHLHMIKPYWDACLARMAEGALGPAWERLRWMVEEYRVSLFAQELKTAETVSPKRLKQALDEALEEGSPVRKH